MEAPIKDIVYINEYLNNQLGENDKKLFLARLEADKYFKDHYHEHLIFVNGINRTELKKSILRAKASYHQLKWIKTGAIIAVVTGLILAFIWVYMSHDPQQQEPFKQEIESIFSGFDNDSTDSKEKENKSIFQDTVAILFEPVESEYSTIAENFGHHSTKKPQIFNVNTERDTIVRCAEGTLIRFAPKSFRDKKTGNEVAGIIQIKVTEFYQLSDMLFANLSTTSDGQLLETGGMLNIEASKSGSQLELKAELPMEISFPKKGNRKGMQLFAGSWEEDGNINWNLQDEELIQINPSVETVENLEVPYAVVERKPIFPGCEDVPKTEQEDCFKSNIQRIISKNFNIPFIASRQDTQRYRLSTAFKISAEGYINDIFVRGDSPRLEAEAKRVLQLIPRLIPGSQRGQAVIVPYSLPIIISVSGDTSSDNNVVVVNSMRADAVRVAYDTIYRNERGLTEYYREMMHDRDLIVDSSFVDLWQTNEKANLIRIYGDGDKRTVRMRKQLFEDYGSIFKILDDDSITRGGHIIRKPWTKKEIPTTTTVMNLVLREQYVVGGEAFDEESIAKKVDSINDQSLDSADVGYFVFKTASLGWINCDRFVGRSKNSIKYKVKLKNSEGSEVKMVFKNLNSIGRLEVKGQTYSFGSIRKDEPVAIVAIKKGKEGLMYDVIDTVAREDQQFEFNFKKTDFKSLKRLINSIGSF